VKTSSKSIADSDDEMHYLEIKLHHFPVVVMAVVVSTFINCSISTKSGE
jgi:hypothetical protein